MAHSSVAARQGGVRQLRTVRPDGTPVYRYAQPTGMPAVTVTRFGGTGGPAASEYPMPENPAPERAAGPPARSHAHDFLVLTYVEQDVGAIEVDGEVRALRAGEVHALLPGQVVTPGPPPAAGSGGEHPGAGRWRSRRMRCRRWRRCRR
ncbi:hypothetical protein BJF85_01510 [Saccharomonospora sp. CUA-673]|uniref:hypothetical protein n=1 Tax=Saccharomonospora sp. CUA-673 TaxID=1904969 RepID=UPI00095A8908|nr:hypothetical protein [Saccharomonospora sp. CUA-673]OLT45124.1 hypothetical protein BJF85_01510 [Saccharomonospora sp. CUA-673]